MNGRTDGKEGRADRRTNRQTDRSIEIRDRGTESDEEIKFDRGCQLAMVASH